MSLTALALALLATAPGPGVPVMPALAAPAPAILQLGEAPELAARTLAAGRSDEARATLERASLADPRDPAVLINLGIAYAQAGDEARARAAFAKALACEEVIELDTADGSSTDSRRLARKALRMLDRGEFRADSGRTGQLTMRN
jgi:tetratricopeptide (TPR) repeat protein